MNTKLTLTVDQETIIKAKKYAMEKGESISGLVENYLKALTAKGTKEKEEITALVKSLRGSFKAPDQYDYKEGLTKALTKKYKDHE